MSTSLLPQVDRPFLSDIFQGLDAIFKSPSAKEQKRNLPAALDSLMDGSIEVSDCSFQLSEQLTYAMRLTNRLPEYLETLASPVRNQRNQLVLRKSEILLDQAYHLMTHGSLQLFTGFGDDYYIAWLVARLQALEPTEDWQGRQAQINSFLLRISGNASLHGWDAAITLHQHPRYCFDFPDDFDLVQWRRDRWHSSVSVPFCRDRVIAFVRDRFDPTFLVGEVAYCPND